MKHWYIISWIEYSDSKIRRVLIHGKKKELLIRYEKFGNKILGISRISTKTAIELRKGDWHNE